MTFTVQDKHSVKAEGTFPYDMEIAYSCTYQKGQVRSGDTAVLALGNMGAMDVARIEVEMKSNKNAGAGTFYVAMNGQQIAQKGIAGLTNEYVTVDLMIPAQDDVNSLELMLVGTENSLYINRYIIYYSEEAQYTVTLMKGEEQVGVQTGTTVDLPSMPEEGEWRFIGWTDEPFYERHEFVPDLIAPGTYQPTENITLWTVYEHITQTEQLIATDLQDGSYLYVNRTSGMAMSGSVWGGKADSEPMDLNNTNQIYEVKFDAEGKATIRLLYVYGTEYIGFYEDQLANEPSKWNVYHEGQKTAFYTTYNNKTYVLFPDKLQGDYVTYRAQLMATTDLEMTPTVLVHADMSVQLYLTCYPEAGMGFESIQDSEIRSQKILHNGQVLIIRQGETYTTTGLKIED